MKCPLCQGETQDDLAVCESCERVIPRCPTCGTVIRERMAFCGNDGTRIPEEFLLLFPEKIEVKSTETTKTDAKKYAFERILLLLITAGVALLLVFLAVNRTQPKKPSVPPAFIEEEIDTSTKETAPKTEETAPMTTERTVTYISQYEIVRSNMSWTEAKAACEARGGHLATVTSVEEYNEICELANQTDLLYLWLGASIPDEETQWSNVKWVTGENWTFENWHSGEPSGTDIDGMAETYLCMWSFGDGVWTFNDQRNDILARIPSVSGLVGYVFEYQVEVLE